ncbi:MerR family transcriptional regulator, partial [Streptomyces sp. NPDC056121]
MNDRPAEAVGIGRAGVGARPVRTGADVTASTTVRYALVAVPRLSLDAVARRSGLHPDLIRRFVALGLVDAERDAAGH